MSNTRPALRTLAAVTADVLAVAAIIAKSSPLTVQLLAPVIEELKREARLIAAEAARKELLTTWTKPRPEQAPPRK